MAKKYEIMKRTSILLLLHSRGASHVIGLSFISQRSIFTSTSVCLFLRASPNETNSDIASYCIKKLVHFSNDAVLDQA